MKSLIILAIIMSGCVMDDQVYDATGLSPKHQRIFISAMMWWNEKDPNAVFMADPDGPSTARYGITHDGATATSYWTPLSKARDIAFMDKPWDDLEFCGVSRHELGHHILGHGHSAVRGDLMYKKAPPCGEP